MTDNRDIDALAGEYALGTLDAAERAAVAERMTSDAELAAAVTAWERSLAPLASDVPPVTPPPAVLAKIKREIAHYSPSHDEDNRVVVLARSRKLWRAAALGMTAMAAMLAIVIGVRETMWARKPTMFVAVLQKDAMSPAFLLSLDTRTRMLTVRPVDAKGAAGKSFELWLVHDRLQTPRSLGLLSDKVPMTSTSLRAYDKSVYMDATYAVSVEPQGGSKTGKPTGPVVFAGKLLPGSL